MLLESVKVQNYTSIIDSNVVKIDPKITALVGMTGAGKSSFLKMLSGIDTKITFKESELPNRSDVKNKFTEGDLSSDEILQLTAVFKVDDFDREFLPDGYKEITGVEVDRYFDGHIVVNPLGKSEPFSINIDSHVGTITGILELMRVNFTQAIPRIGELNAHTQNFSNAIENFKQTNFTNLKEFDLSLQTLTNAINGIPKDPPFQNEINQRIAEINNVRAEIVKILETDPLKKIFELIPKPLYKENTFPLEDKIAVDVFIANPFQSPTFHTIAVITGLKQSGLQKAKTTTPAERESYLGNISQKLSDRLNRFWSQEKYHFKLDIEGANLVLTISDDTTKTPTSIIDRSDGFKWWTAFFLEISAHISEKSSSSIILLDNPATDLHDEGKADVLRFINDVVKESGKLQIVYTTHERALIDPWRIDRIRVVEKRPAGTKIDNVRSDTRLDLLDKIRRNIGSPAKYSLFGAPRSINFEGISDINLISALNEHFEQQEDFFLNKDSYSINAFNGISNAPEFCKIYKNLGIDFTMVVDSGDGTELMKKNLEDGDFEKHFIEIKQVLDKYGDTEDLFDPKIYHLAFETAYKNILEHVPTLEEIQKKGTGKKTVNKYEDWFKSIDKEFNKTIVSQQMFKVIMQDNIREIEKDAFRKTVENFTKLFTLLEEKARVL